VDRPDAGARLEPKKAYQRPELRIYGDLAAITLTVGKTRNSDGGMAMDGKNFTGP
jgi:hypothetical protein